MKPEFSGSAQSVTPRALRLLTEDQRSHLLHLHKAGAMLVMSEKMPKAAIIVSKAGQDPEHIATLDRAEASELAERGWVAGQSDGRVARLRLTHEGRQILQLATARGENAALGCQVEEDEDAACEPGKTARRRRHSTGEAPILALARRRDKNGKPFLTKDLLRAGDRLREDFESAHIGTRTTQDWNQLLSGAVSGGGFATSLPGMSAERFRNALSELGPGLAEIALLCCCYQEGLESAEKKMGWSARSAKIVLRIALQRLRRYYDDLGERGEFIG